MEDDERFDDHEERRQHNRSRLIVDVHFDGQESTGVASSKDISLGGLYMNTQADVPRGGTLIIRIPLGEKDIVCTAEVVYKNPGQGLGIRFLDLSDEARALLQRELSNA